jgi:hypothetical protein
MSSLNSDMSSLPKVVLPNAYGRNLVYQSVQNGKAEQAIAQINAFIRISGHYDPHLLAGEMVFSPLTKSIVQFSGKDPASDAQIRASYLTWEKHVINFIAKELAPSSDEDQKAISDYFKSMLSEPGSLGIDPRLRELFQKIITNKMESNEENLAKLQAEAAQNRRDQLNQLQTDHQTAIQNYVDYASLQLSREQQALLVAEITKMQAFSDSAKQNRANMLKLVREAPCNHELSTTLLNKYELENLSIRNLPSNAHPSIIPFFTKLKEIDGRRTGDQAQVLYRAISTHDQQIRRLNSTAQLDTPSSPAELATQASQLPEKAPSPISSSQSSESGNWFSWVISKIFK